MARGAFVYSWEEVGRLGCIIHDIIRHLAPIPMSAHALVTISQRFEHVEYLRYLVGLFGAPIAQNFFPWPVPVKR